MCLATLGSFVPRPGDSQEETPVACVCLCRMCYDVCTWMLDKRVDWRVHFGSHGSLYLLFVGLSYHRIGGVFHGTLFATQASGLLAYLQVCSSSLPLHQNTADCKVFTVSSTKHRAVSVSLVLQGVALRDWTSHPKKF
jgi:hypothetical protein